MYDIKADFRKGLIPNAITFFGLTMIVPIIVFHREGMYGFALAYFIIAWICDGLDGKIARKYKLQSKIGEFFDPLADKVFTWSMLLFLWDRVPTVAALTIMALGLLATFGRIIILAANRHLPVAIDVMAGKAGKYKTNFEKAGLVALLLSDLLEGYLCADTAAPTLLDCAVISKPLEFLSCLGLWLSIPLAIISFLAIVLKMKRLWHETH